MRHYRQCNRCTDYVVATGDIAYQHFTGAELVSIDGGKLYVCSECEGDQLPGRMGAEQVRALLAVKDDDDIDPDDIEVISH